MTVSVTAPVVCVCIHDDFKKIKNMIFVAIIIIVVICKPLRYRTTFERLHGLASIPIWARDVFYPVGLVQSRILLGGSVAKPRIQFNTNYTRNAPSAINNIPHVISYGTVTRVQTYIYILYIMRADSSRIK